MTISKKAGNGEIPFFAGRLAIIYIATLTAARTFPWTPGDPQLAGIPCQITISEITDSEITMHPGATVWLSEDKERLPETVLHQLPVHRPEPTVAYTIWWPRDCIPKVEIHLRPYGIMPHTHPTNRQQSATHRAEVTPELLQDRLYHFLQGGRTVRYDGSNYRIKD